LPRGFTQEEIYITKEQLLTKGKDLFIRYGYKKFGVRDLTAAVGIANGTFYKFFSSKEELIFTILDIERKKAREKIREEIAAHINEPVNALKAFYYIVIRELHDNPMMKILLQKDEYSYVTGKMTQEQLLKERTESLDPLLEIAEYWKSKGLVRDIDMNVVIGSLRALVLLWFHKSEIGEQQYQQTIDFMIERICDYVLTYLTLARS